jgi:hypothetical protein
VQSTAELAASRVGRDTVERWPFGFFGHDSQSLHVGSLRRLSWLGPVISLAMFSQAIKAIQTISMDLLSLFYEKGPSQRQIRQIPRWVQR